MTHDLQVLLQFLAVLLLLVFMTIGAVKTHIAPEWLSRKIMNAGIFMICAVSPLFIHRNYLLIYGVLLCSFFFFLFRNRFHGFTKKNVLNPKEILLFATAFIILLLLFPDKPRLIFCSVSVLGICDFAAKVTGYVGASSFYNLTGSKKSFLGNIAFFISFLILMGSLIHWMPDFLPPIFRSQTAWLLVPLIGILLMCVESISSEGTQRFFLPIAAAAILWRMNPAIPVLTNQSVFIAYCIVTLAGLAAAFTVKIKVLTPNGAVMAALMGSWVSLFSDVLLLLPLIVFFGSSILIGKIVKHPSTVSDSKHGKPRDWVQVWSNGGLYAFLLTFYYTTQWYQSIAWIFCGIIVSVAIADTWASEIGSAVKGKVIDIVRFKPVPSGISGGISFVGTFAGLTGAFLFSLFFLFLLPWEINTNQKTILVLLFTLSGFSGMLIDSVLGSLFQSKYKDIHGQLNDKPSQGSVMISGLRWMTNDLVNQLSILFALLIWLIILFFLRNQMGLHLIIPYF